MQTLTKLAMVTLLASTVVGCAASSYIPPMQTQIDSLTAETAQISATAKRAHELADEAAQRANAAEAAANRAAEAAQGTSTRLDSLFHRAMVK